MITNRRTNIISERTINYSNTEKIKRLNIKKSILEYINTNFREFVCVIALFLIGIIVSIIFVNNMNETQSKDISEYIQEYVNKLKEGSNINKKAVFLEDLKNNFVFMVILWFAGLTIIGIPIVFITVIYKGFTFGYTTSAIMATLGRGKGTIFIFSSMLLQNILAIPAILIMAVSGINLYKVIIKNKERKNIKIELIKHTIICLLMVNIMIIEAFIEGYVSTFFIESIKLIL